MEKDIKIAIVDDNKDYLFTMETFLKRNGFEVFTAEDGKKGIDLIQKEKPDLILLDIMMETTFSGFEICKQIRADLDLKEIPIIGISGMGEELNVNYDQWRDDEYFNPEKFLEKPIDKERLLIVIDEVLKKAEDRRKRPKWRKDLDEKMRKKWHN